MIAPKLIPVRIPADLVREIDRYVGPEQRSQFVIEACQRELIRRKQMEALREAGAGRDEDHAELPDTVEGLRKFLRQSAGP